MTTDPLLEIRKEKAQLRRQMEQSRQAMRQQVRNIFEPVPQAANRVQLLSSLLGNGWAILEGLRLGLGLFRASRKVFGKR